MASSSAGLVDSLLDPNQVRLGPRDFALLSSFIQREVGIQVPPAKRVMLESRLRRRLRALGLSDFHAYTSRVFGPKRDEAEIINLIDAVTTNKTDFFREPHHFEFLARQALPQLVDLGLGTTAQPLRLWSAASSTGEEPYTIAMVMSELSEKQPLSWQVLATDISTSVLARARRAIYAADSAAPIPAALKFKYLMRSRERTQKLVRVVPRLRQKVTFQRLNLLSQRYAIPQPVDVVFCRNVFIYFDRATQRQIMMRFVQALRPGGFVFLGHSESIAGLSVPLAQIAPTIYRKEP
jgi:chemotaxis protein methyltransferase CheR